MRTVCLLANGYGIETNKTTYSLYDKKLTPNVNYLYDNYLFTTVLASGPDLGFDDNRCLDDKSGYRVFSEGPNPYTSYDYMQKMFDNEGFINEQMKAIIHDAKMKGTYLHIFFPFGNNVNKLSAMHLGYFVHACEEQVVKVRIHLISGDNTAPKGRYFLEYFKLIKRYLRNSTNWEIVFVSGVKYLKDSAGNTSHVELYKMNTSTVAQVWPEIEETVAKRFDEGAYDEDIKPFLLKRERVFNDNDIIFVFNYNPLDIERYLAIISKPESLFSAGYLPKNISISSLFTLSDKNIYPHIYEYPEMKTSFARKLEKRNYPGKITLIAEASRIHYIAETLSGSKNLSPKFDYKAVAVGEHPYSDIMQIVINELKGGPNDVIIADFDLARDYKLGEIKTIENNFSEFDKSLKPLFDLVVGRKDNMIITSLYGIKTEIANDVKDTRILDMSAKVPFILVSYNYSRTNMSIRGSHVGDTALAIIGVQDTIYPGFLMRRNPAKERQKKLVQTLLIIIIVAIMIFFFIFK